ncbi:MAG: U32 family peptidase [Rhodospirillales bacterium]|jgi:collagenase-like PrtC family protease|nr:U32 family peptidase [Rhodospirillales bacterium]
MTSPFKISIGPLLFHWTPERRRDFYFRMADEAPVDVVHLGEVVCSKRAPFFDPMIPEVAERLQKAGKEVVLSTLALVTSDREMEALEGAAEAGLLVEINDVAGVPAVKGRPFVAGPYINLFNEDTLKVFEGLGAVRACLHVEASAQMARLLSAVKGKMELEMMVFGRLPLTVSARCYHARAHGLAKDSCQYVCGFDADGKPVDTMDGQNILIVNGTETMSHGYVNLAGKLPELQEIGISHLRLMPQDVDMVAVSKLWRDAVDGRLSPAEAESGLRGLCPEIPFVDGYWQGREGLAWSGEEAE